MTTSRSNGRRSAHPTSRGATPQARHEHDTPRRSSRRRRSRSVYANETQSPHTSLPTSRKAYLETRRWLLDSHGPICAYCSRRTDAEEITLDHVTPRRGQSAYDRRDNLVLACTPCNGKKADKPILAFLLADRKRAFNMLRYGMHLSPMLRDLATEIAGPDAAARAERLADPDYPYAD